MKATLRARGLHTVCEEARCPNISECFGRGVATFMILGDTCTRKCGFCGVAGGVLKPPDPQEPGRVAQTAEELGLSYVVVTSVSRDDLPDFGAGQFAETINKVKERIPECRVEVLVPDFMGKVEEVARVCTAGPDVFNHNVETVPGLYAKVRPQADFERSLSVLKTARKTLSEARVKSGLMVGLGEEKDELNEVFRRLKEAGCDMLTIGQYFRPSKTNLAVEKYYLAGEFENLRRVALDMGFLEVSSGPFVRSSFNAEMQFSKIRR